MSGLASGSVIVRTPYQGVRNVVRFNWPFYAAAVGVIGTCVIVGAVVPRWRRPARAGAAFGFYATAASLAATHWVYDRSDLYRFRWLDDCLAAAGFRQNPPRTVVSLNAGFDETSDLLRRRYPNAQVRILDFYDPKRHTEASIARARRAYPPHPGTEVTSISALPLVDESVALALALLSAHEVRESAERRAMLTELRRVLAPGGRLVIVEHLRDEANFFAYGLGAFHFHSRRSWFRDFAAADLCLLDERCITPFVTAFTLGRRG